MNVVFFFVFLFIYLFIFDIMKIVFIGGGNMVVVLIGGLIKCGVVVDGLYVIDVNEEVCVCVV